MARSSSPTILAIFVLNILILLVGTGVLECEGRSVTSHNGLQHHHHKDREPHIPQPGLVFGDLGGEDDLTSGSSGLGPKTLIDPAIGGTFRQDEEYMKEVVMNSFRKLIRKTRSPQRSEDEEEDDNESDEDNDNTKEVQDEPTKSSTTPPSSTTSSTTKPPISSTKPDQSATPKPNAPPAGAPTASQADTPKPPQQGVPGSQGPQQKPQGGSPGSQTSSGPPPGAVPGKPTGLPPGAVPGKPSGLPPGAVPGKPSGLPPGAIPGRPSGLPPGAIPGRPPGAPGRPPGLPPNFKLPPHLLPGAAGAKKPTAKKGTVYLPEDYNKLEIPKLDAGRFLGLKNTKLAPVPVLVFLNLRSVRDIDETDNELVLDMDMKVEWVDGVLFDPFNALSGKASKPLTLDPIFLNQIWKPDIYIDELVRVYRAKLISKPHTLLFSPSTGLVSYTFRIATRVSCEMDFYYYPADTHRCNFHLRSYSYFDEDLNLSWLRNGVYLQDPGDPNFDLQVDSIETTNIDQTFKEKKNNTHDGLRFTILCRRKLSYHMVQTYLPSIFFIVITWLCFLVPARMVEARIGISMTTLLTLTAMFSSVRESTPIVSYVKAIDIWMVFCIFFVFLTLLEFSLLVWIRSFREDALEKKLDSQRTVQAQEKRGSSRKGRNGRGGGRSPSPSPSVGSVELKRYENVAEFTEKWAFLIFSIVFIIFLVVYWSWLLDSSNYFNWTVNATHNAIDDDTNDAD